MLQSWMSDTVSLPIGEIAMKAKEAIWRKCECKKCGRPHWNSTCLLCTRSWVHIPGLKVLITDNTTIFSNFPFKAKLTVQRLIQ